MTENSGYTLETLRQGGELTLHGGREHGKPFTVLLVAPAAEQPSPQSLRWLEQGYSLAAELDSAWAARPLVPPRQHPIPEPPEVIAGTLAYMAPEQTGWMNRSVDSRSDPYALGVTFYEMLTGTLPFTAADYLQP